MFDNLNWWEIIALLLLALFIFGPERLPKVIGDGLRMLRTVRDMARNATSDLSRELGTDVRLEDLNPRNFIRRHLLSEEEQANLRRPFDEAYRDVRQIAADANDYRRPQPELPAGSGADPRPSAPAQGVQGHPVPDHPGPSGYGSDGYDSSGSDLGPRGYDAEAT